MPKPTVLFHSAQRVAVEIGLQHHIQLKLSLLSCFYFPCEGLSSFGLSVCIFGPGFVFTLPQKSTFSCTVGIFVLLFVSVTGQVTCVAMTSAVCQHLLQTAESSLTDLTLDSIIHK